MRHLKLSLIVLLTLICSIALSGCGGSIAATNTATGTGTLIISASTIDFGQVAVGKTVSTSITLTNTGSAAVEISTLTLTGQPFSMSGGSSVPMSVGANASVTVTIKFNPAASGSATGQLTIASNASNASSASVALSGMGVPMLTGLNCVIGSVTGASSDTCTVTLNATAASGGLNVALASNDSAVTVPASVTVPTGASSATFNASISPVTTVQAATLTASVGGVAQTFAVELGAAIPILGISANNLAFGTVPVSSAVTHPLVLSSTGTMPVTVSAASLTGAGFAITSQGLPVTLAPGQTTTLSLQFAPGAAGAEIGQLSLTSNSSNGTSMVVGLSGTGVPGLLGLSCTNGSIIGSGTDSCTVTLNTAAASGGFAVSLASNNSLVTVPSSVIVPAGATSAIFTANVSPVNSSESATLTASVGTSAETFGLQLIASAPKLSLSSPSLSFGNVNVSAAATQSLTLSSTGNSPLTINAATLAGTGFAATGATFPLTLNPNQTATLNVQFNPTAAGASSGSLTFNSNSSTGSSTAVALSGTGVPVLTGLSCVNTSMTGAGSDSCTVTLNVAAASGGFAISLASNNPAVTVPAQVMVAGGATSATFAATVSAVNVAQAVTLTASADGVTQTFGLQLGAAAIGLGVSSSSLSFGNVNVNTATTQTLTLSSAGTSAVTISAATVSGTGFTVSGVTFPITLTGNQTATLTVQFDPTTAGAATGQLTLTSNSSGGTSTLITLSGTGLPVLSGLNCTNGSMTGAGTDSCTVTLTVTAAGGGFAVNLASNNSAVTVPATVTVAAGSTTGSFSATVSSVSTAQTVTLTASANSVAKTFALQLGASAITLGVSSSSLSFGNVNVNTATTKTLTLSSTGTSAVTVSAATLTGSGYTISGITFPITLNPNQTATLTVQFDPTVAGAAAGQLTLTSNSSGGSSTLIGLSGTGVPVLSALTCTSGSFTGAGTDSCTVTLNVAAASGGFAVNLASNNSAVTVPATVTVAAGSTTGSFTATVSSVSTAQTVTLTASANSVSKTFALQLGSGVPTLSVSAGSIGFGSVNVNTPTTQTLTLSSTGTSAVTISAATLTGSGYAISGVTFPITLNPNQTATLTVQFDPTTAGAAAGQLTLTSNSSSGTSTVISLSGMGLPVLSALTCTNGSMTGAGTDGCTVTLSVAAASGGFAVSLASNNSAVTVPATVTVAAGSSTGSFTATVSSVSTAQTVTLTASANSVAKTFALQLGAGVPTLSVNATTIAFGDVTLNTPSTQSVTLTSTGTAPVTVNAATVSGTGFTISGGPFPITLNPNQTTTISVQFDPLTAVALTGQLTITSNSSTGSSKVIGLSGTGVDVSYEVSLTWDAPTSSPDPVVGYNVYRAPSGSTNYQQLNSGAVTQTNYIDTTVANGQTYDYIVESVDSAGVTSTPSNMAAVPIP